MYIFILSLLAPVSSDPMMMTLNYIVCLAVPLLSAIVSILTRHLKHVRPTVLMYWFGVGATVVGLTGFFATTDVKTAVNGMAGMEFFYLLIICFLGMCGNISYTVAMRFVSPTKGNVFRGFEVIANFLLQIFYQGYQFHPSGTLGIAALLMAVALIPNEVKLRAKCAFRSQWLERWW